MNQLFILAIIIVVFITIVLEFSVAKGWVSYFNGRKILHFVAVSVCAYVIENATEIRLLGILFIAFSVVLVGVIMLGILNIQRDKSLGIALFPLAFGLLILSDRFDHFHIATAAWILSICDPLAGVFGQVFGRNHYSLILERKSVIGFLAFFVSTLVILFVRCELSVEIILFSALMIAISELFSAYGSDNLSIPIFSAFWLQMMTDANFLQLPDSIYVAIILIIFAAFAHFKNWLDIGGAIAAWFIGTNLIMVQGLEGLYSPTFLLIFGTLISRIIHKSRNKEIRNAKQVFANGLVGTLCFCWHYVNGGQEWILLGFGAFAISICDTMSSEIGSSIKGRTYDVFTWKTISPGISGGVSLEGTLAGGFFLFLFVVGISYQHQGYEDADLGIIFLIGFIGMIVDSLLGSSLQGLYQNEKKEFYEENVGNRFIIVKGYKWIDNHMVNILSICITTAIAWTILYLV